MKTAYDIIIKPVITERSMDDAQERRYTFHVAPNANKTQVKHALEEIFDIEIARVNIMNVKGKMKRQGRTQGMTAASKKAIVMLKPSSKEIEFFQGL